ncbi:MAG TPA: glycosyltransferase [Candidatus Polarisedimenticolia bacterium]|nr:glycosyltransferase [Candidatus Polarisedimenticolia bacterium]
MRILYVAMKYDYGRPEQGESFEHWNFYDPLVRMGHDLLYFDFLTLLGALGREGMNRRLMEVARAEKPEVMFTILFRDELDPDVVRRISRDTDTVTVSWFCDDVWRFDDFTRRWAPCFNWAVTTAASALPRYERIGMRNVIRSQYACNHDVYRRLDLPPRYDVTFIGQPHGNRREIVETLRDAGLRVEAWGQGWENGRLTQRKMIEVFNQSRINLNLANASSLPATLGERARGAVLRAAAATLRRVPGSAPLRSLGKKLLFRQSPDRRASGRPPAPPLDEAPDGATLPSQMKGRNFEVPGCGGFLLTDPALELERFYEPDREVAVYHSPRDLVEKARHYLAHEDERASIAAAGHSRTLREHTYVHRFSEIFRTIGLPAESAETILTTARPPGDTLEIR